MYTPLSRAIEVESSLGNRKTTLARVQSAMKELFGFKAIAISILDFLSSADGHLNINLVSRVAQLSYRQLSLNTSPSE